MEYKQIVCELSYEDDCTSEERYIRLGLGATHTNNRQGPSYYFHVSHDRFYPNDTLALAIYTEEGHKVGYIRKDSENPYFPSGQEIEDHCFENGNLKKIAVKQDFDNMILIDYGIHQSSSEINDLKRKSDFILYEENNVTPQRNEIETLEYALDNSLSFGLSNHQKDCLSKRLSEAKFDSSSKKALDAASKITDATVDLVEAGVSIIGSFFKKR